MEKPPFIRIEPNSFALFTFTHRLPKVVADVRSRPAWSHDADRRLALLAASLPAAEIPRSLFDGLIDPSFWQGYLAQHEGIRWVDLPFFEAEFVFYHLLLSAVRYGDRTMRDPFAEQKRAGLREADGEAARLAEWLDSAPPDWSALESALAISLWANKADLSQLNQPSSVAELLVDDRGPALEQLARRRVPCTLDIVLDNSGAELVGDMVLVDIALRAMVGVRIRLHAKPHPFFVSDATVRDCEETIEHLRGHATLAAQRWGERLSRYLEAGKLELCTDLFWSRPLTFAQLSGPLQRTLHEAEGLLLKGDLNYRKYVEDRLWPHDQRADLLRLPDLPATLALRVLKSELLVGISAQQSRALSSADPAWMSSGTRAVIQLFG